MFNKPISQINNKLIPVEIELEMQPINRRIETNPIFWALVKSTVEIMMIINQQDPLV